MPSSPQQAHHWEASGHVAAPQAAAARVVQPEPVAAQSPVVEATEDEALSAAVEDVQRMGGGSDLAARPGSVRVAKEVAVRQRQADRERLRRSQMVQSIALCKKLGIRYRTEGAVCPP